MPGFGYFGFLGQQDLGTGFDELVEEFLGEQGLLGGWGRGLRLFLFLYAEELGVVLFGCLH